MTSRLRRSGRRAAWSGVLAGGVACLTVGAVLLSAPSVPARDLGTVPVTTPGTSTPGTSTPGPSTPGPSTPTAAGTGARAVAPQAASAAARQGLPSRPVPPVGLRLLRLGIAAKIVPVGVDAQGALGVPADPGVLGWWSGGSGVRGTRGTIAVDGHLDSARLGIGFFARLRELRPGDRVQLDVRSGAAATYVVTGRRYYPREHLPAAVFDQAVGQRLVLITCGGRFDRTLRHYTDTVVVYATPDAGR